MRPCILLFFHSKEVVVEAHLRIQYWTTADNRVNAYNTRSYVRLYVSTWYVPCDSRGQARVDFSRIALKSYLKEPPEIQSMKIEKY